MNDCEGPSRVVLGKIVGVYGIKGWVKVFSETAPREGILGYSPWIVGVEGGFHRVAEGRRQGKGIIARLAGCDDRDHAAAFVGKEISVPRDRLPPPSADEFYWIDLEGLRVSTTNDVDLGRVDHLFSTGANDVLVVKGDRERLLPFVWGDVVKDVDFPAGRIQVDWDPDF